MTAILNGPDVANHHSVKNANNEVNASNQLLTDLTLEAAELVASNIPGVGHALDAKSFWQNYKAGSWGGMFVDAVGMIPGFGDGAKSALRGTRIARSAQNALESLNAAKSRLDVVRKAEAARLYRKFKNKSPFEKYQDAISKCQDEACIKKAREQYKKDRYERLPKAAPGKGKWSGSPGNSKYIPDPESPLGKTLRDNYPDQQGIHYRDGYPDFSPFAKEQVSIPNMKGDGHKGTGHLSDEAQARAIMRERSPGWTKADEDGYVWHHKQDGSSMMLVDKDVHNTTQGGVAHVGGASMTQDPKY